MQGTSSAAGRRYRLSALPVTVKNALFPARCCACGRFYLPGYGKAPRAEENDLEKQGCFDLSEFLCRACLPQVEPHDRPVCSRCGRFFDTLEGVDHLCGNCLETPFEFSMARAAGKYEGALKDLICLFKYHGRSELAPYLGRLLWHSLRMHWRPECFDWIIPVPLHRRRMRERGFNQSELLVGLWPRLAAEQGLSLGVHGIARRSLMRHVATRPQTGLDGKQRAANLKSVFRLRDPAAVKGRNILLVDDVLTTGATANACARVLLAAKAASVTVLTLARTG